MKKSIFLSSAVALLALSSIFAANFAYAAEFVSPEESGSVKVSSTETHKNLYTAGSDVRVESVTSGDLFVAGGQITVDGAIEQDATVAGGEVTLNGAIGGDVRAAGGMVTINGTVGGDVIVFGGEIRISDKSVIGGDVVVFSGLVIIDAPVTGSIRVNGGDATINNKVGGELKIRSDSLTFGSRAEAMGKISYKGEHEATVENGAKVSAIEFQKVEHRHNSAGDKIAKIFTIGFILKLLASIAAGLLFMKLLPKTTQHVVDSMERKTWVNLGIGFLGLVVTPIAAIFLTVLLVGWYIAVLSMLGYIMMLMLAGVASAIFAGSWIVKMLTKKPTLVVDWQAVVIGVVVLAILKFIPVIGWIALFMLMLIAFGALIRLLKDRIDSEQTKPAEVN